MGIDERAIEGHRLGVSVIDGLAGNISCRTAIAERLRIIGLHVGWNLTFSNCEDPVVARDIHIPGFRVRGLGMELVSEITNRLNAAIAVIVVINAAETCFLPFLEFQNDVRPAIFLVLRRTVGRIGCLAVIRQPA